MKTVLLSSFLILVLLTTNLAWADLPPSTTLGVEVLQTEYSNKASDGTTVVYGEIQNDLNSPVNAVTIGVTFMDSNSNQIEYKTGTTLLQVIQPGGKAPFMISSTKADPSIVQVQVKVAGFQSSSAKQQVLQVSPGSLQISDTLLISGNITNSGAQQSANTKLYLISYDAFQRVVAIGVSNPISIGSGTTSQFSITSDYNTRAISYVLIAESDLYQSKSIQNSLNVLPVSVSNTMVTNLNGTSYSTVPINSEVKITSKLSHVLSSTQPFVYYVQVKQFNGKSEFIGKSEGIFLGLENQNASVNWTPSTAGSYFVETYVWNYDSVPLSSSVPSINVVLVK
ncbi:MAG: FxLYD domain-containing protein [Nitrosotalea sp.]